MMMFLPAADHADVVLDGLCLWIVQTHDQPDPELGQIKEADQPTIGSGRDQGHSLYGSESYDFYPQLIIVKHGGGAVLLSSIAGVGITVRPLVRCIAAFSQTEAREKMLRVYIYVYAKTNY
jgi:hypothetical protein